MSQVYVRMRAYNAEKTIARAIDSILNQTYSTFHFYICDNGSSDNTKKIIESYARNDSRIVPFYNKENMIFDEHTVAFRDLALHIGEDDFYCSLDADDEYLPSFLEDMLSFMNRYQLDIACCGTAMFQVTETNNMWKAQMRGQRVLSSDLILTESQFGTCYSTYHAFMRPNWGKIFKGSTLYDTVTNPDDYPGWPRAYGGDTIISFRALRHAKRMGVLAKVLHRYYIMPKSISSKFSENRIVCDQILHQDAINFLSTYGAISIENWSFLYAVYMSAISDTINVLLRSASTLEEKLEAVIDICEYKETKLLAAWKYFNYNFRAQRVNLFQTIAGFLLSLEEVPDEKMESFCNIGEFVCAASEDSDGWVFFQKLRISFFVQNNRVKEASLKYSELSALIPDDPFIQEWEQTLAPKVDISDLCEEINFPAYLEYLRHMSKKYTILIAARDTPWGRPFTPELTAKLMAIGLKINLYHKYRYAYAAIIDQGNRVFEQISSRLNEKVVWSGKIGQTAISLESRGYEVAPSMAKIQIQGKDYSVSLRGLNIVVYDKTTDCIIDTVNFDTYADSLACTRPDELSKKLFEWHKTHPKIALLCFNKPDFPKHNLSENEAFILENIHSQGDSYRFINHPQLPLKLFF